MAAVSSDKYRCRHRVTAHDTVNPDTPGQAGFARLPISGAPLRPAIRGRRHRRRRAPSRPAAPPPPRRGHELL